MRQLLTIIITLSIITSAACQATPQADPTTPAVIAQNTATNIPRPTATTTQTPLPTATATRTPSPTQTAPLTTDTPAPTPTIDPTLPFDATEAAVITLLHTLPTDYFYHLPISHPSEQTRPSADDLTTYRETKLKSTNHLITLQYDDVDQDGQPDLLAIGETMLAIFFHSGENYQRPLIYISLHDGHSLSTRYHLADWTNDGRPELILDYQIEERIGTDVWVTQSHRHILQCAELACHSILTYNPLTTNTQLNTGGTGTETNTAEFLTDPDGLPQIALTNEFFSFDALLPSSNSYTSSKLTARSQTLYIWENEAFTPIVTIDLAPAEPLVPTAVLTATSGANTAVIDHEPTNSADLDNAICQLIFNEQPTGTRFNCKHPYTTLDWRNIIADQTPELILTTLSLPTSTEQAPSTHPCLQQQLWVYRLQNDTLTEIANTAGCVRQADLFGVRLEDVDQDGTLEILTAGQTLLKTADCLNTEPEQPHNCWQDLNTDTVLYQWDGTRFTVNEQ